MRPRRPRATALLRYLFVAGAAIGFASTLSASLPERGYARPTSGSTSADTGHADSLASLLRRLEPKVAPVAGVIDSMIGVLRADSGTIRADSAFMRARTTLHQLVWAIRVHDDAVFQRMAYPIDLRSRRSAAERDIAVADSLARYLAARGIWIAQGEGQSWVAFSESVLLRRLGHFLTESMREYQQILIDEQTEPTGEDASLMIAWDSLGERLARTDRFLATYPGAAASGEVRSLYDAYLRWYVLGTGNTSVFDWRPQVLNLEVHRSYERYAAAHGSTTSGRIIRGYLEVLRRNRFRYGPAVRKYILANTDWSPGAL